jgi:hypothetical protein
MSPVHPDLPSLPDTPPALLLGHHLKQFRLPTVLREYEKVARNLRHRATTACR